MVVAFALASFRVRALFSLWFDHGEVLEEVIRIPQARAEQQAQAQALLEIAHVCVRRTCTMLIVSLFLLLLARFTL